jgi:UDP-GlcNAc:undecaprenyl-phosphate GlcNAc-1-phosphate transferase
VASSIVWYLVTFGVAFGLALGLTPLVGRLARRWGLEAVPGGRRQHPRRVPKLGAAAIYGAFLVAVIVAQFLPVVRMDDKEGIRLIGLLAGGTVLLLIGLLDDWRELPAWPQFAGQLLAAGIAIACLIHI